MELHEHIAALRREGEKLAAVAANADLDAPVPTCPEWRLRDLLRHTSEVHRWATVHVAQGRTQPMDEQEEAAFFGQWPGDGALLDWFRDGHAALVYALETAAPDLLCWSFLPAPSPLAFWARRQAHETAIHRADAEAAGGPISPFPPDFAADGIGELLDGFVSRPRDKLRADPPRTLQIPASDADMEWVVIVGPERAEVRHEHAGADCTVQGSASDLYLLLWNRLPADGFAVRGDATLLDLWRRSVRIRWG